MNQARLNVLLNQFPHRQVLVVGDFFLDEYLIIDRQLSEPSLETGLEAYQVVDIRHSPGAAGTVVSNLRALGVAATALGVIGQETLAGGGAVTGAAGQQERQADGQGCQLLSDERAGLSKRHQISFSLLFRVCPPAPSGWPPV